MRLVFLVVFIGLVTILIGSFLSPDDLKECTNGPSGEGSCRRVDAIIAISGGDTTARTNEAISLYKSGWAPRLVFSGAAEDTSGPSNAAVMRKIALGAGVPDSAIMIDEFSQTTKQNAQETTGLLEGEDISSVILVTSGYHQRRASLEFKKHLEDVKVLSHPADSDSNWSVWWWLTPFGWYLALGEIVRIVMFYLGATR